MQPSIAIRRRIGFGCLAVLVLSCFIVGIRFLVDARNDQSRPERELHSTLESWRQFDDSCSGVFTARDVRNRPVHVTLIATDRDQRVEASADVPYERIRVGDELRFSLFQTACGAITTWMLRDRYD